MTLLLWLNDFLALKCGCYMLICRDQLGCARQSGARSENDRAYRTVCFYHVTYAFQSESTLYSCLNVKKLLARSRHEIWLNGWVFVYELSGCGFESSCSHVHIGFGNLSTAVTTDDEISSYLAKAEMTVHIGF